MSSLIETLQRITPWYRDTDYEVIQTFPHGLPFEDVENWLGALPFQVPQEVYEIYQWCNGRVNPTAARQMPQTDVYFYNIDYMANASVIPLKESVDLWFENNDEDQITKTWYHFPVFSHENGLIVIVGSDQQQESSPVWDVDWLNDELGKPVFPNITSMMTGIADVIEAEREFWDDLGYFNDDREYWNVCKSIWKKYRA
ncbi:hypothetical protein VB713_01705 [Anabaena cylindrica UHCC 0172]|uniref:hypothetical protein n=1 Tax=Anabaena cylindrica TaxID=1165 RepID=UPI002B21DA25|nr:hypothetical protein [Anabaena cylindrica]MEA5549705.1 hypothetical protein [Anabaena cylindrica UHCC 0172]